MTSTFKVAQPGFQLNFVPYNGPPAPKAKRPQAPPQREESIAEYALPDLLPDNAFDHINDESCLDQVENGNLTVSVDVTYGQWWYTSLHLEKVDVKLEGTKP
jgi:hypothetical protein